MFKKKPNVWFRLSLRDQLLTTQQIKPLAPLRSSDRRRIADQIIANFSITTPSEEGGDKAENGHDTTTVGIGAIRNSLLPENSQSARFTTTAGKDLKQVSGTVYVGAHPGEEQRVLWIKLEDRLIPTIYTLWRNPRIVPLLHTPDIVLQKLQGGADLMTPGLASGPPFPSGAVKDSVVAVASLEKPTVPMVVGTCQIDVASLQEVRSAKGHAVRGEHWHGDEIWAWSSGGGTGRPAPDGLLEWGSSNDGNALADKLDEVAVEDSDDEHGQGGVPVHQEPVEDSKPVARNDFVEGEDGNPYEEIGVEQKEFSTKGK